MTYQISIDTAASLFPEFTFICALTPSAQKSAFHVKDKINGEDLCLKLIAPDYAIDRLDREIRAMQKISHPNVVRLKRYVFSATEAEQRHYIIEEFVAGSDLTDQLGNGPWEQSVASTFFIQLCGGLQALADQQIVHRDLKPSNIRVRPNRSPVIIDFGIARHLALADLTPTMWGARLGTVPYFAPEQFIGTRKNIDPRTDLFAVGILLYYALVGRHPFWKPGMTEADLADTICRSDDYRGDQHFSTLPLSWRTLINRLLQKERARRPSNANQVIDILTRLGP